VNDSYYVAGWYLLIVALLPALTVGAWMGEALNLERQRTQEARQERTHESARARAAERPYRQRLAPSRRGIYARATPITVQAPSDEFLDAWDREIDGLPWGSAASWGPIDVIDDPEACTPRLAPTVRPSTARLRRLVAA